MPTHSSILASRIPWTEDPGRLESTGSQRIGQDWATDTLTFTLSFFLSFFFFKFFGLTAQLLGS